MSDRRPMVPLQRGDQMSQLTRQEIRAKQDRSVPWVSPHHGDGGWHTTPGMQDADVAERLIPLRDRITVKLFPEPEVVRPSLIVRPDSAVATNPETRRGVILRVGPGRWIDGEFIRTEVKPGMEVSIGPHDDWNSLHAGFGDEVVICQEADIRVIHGKVDSIGTKEDQDQKLRAARPAVSDRRPLARKKRPVARERQRHAGRKG
jgi:co-chaperonin GroES (HSP10)